LAATVEEAHLASESADIATVTSKGQQYLAIAAELVR
jgi:hypothetical protein